MITAHVEEFSANIEQLKELIPLHYEELAMNKDKVPLSPRWECYERSEAAGELLLIVLRDEGRMAGYFIGFVAPGLHYSTCLTCIQDIFYVKPDERGAAAGNILFDFVESELKRRGVQRLITNSKNHFPAAWLFNRRGYEEIETIHSLWLGGE
jgi:GNAT superfamily N-acetyltransferase